MKINLTQRVLSLALAFLVLMNGLGVFVVSYAEVGFHRIFEKTDASEQGAQTLKLSGSEFSSILWIGEKDFIYGGSVYDCAGFSSAKGKILVRCFIDHEETNVKKSIADNFENGTKNSCTSHPVKIFFKVFPVFPGFEKINLITTEHSSSFSYNKLNSENPDSVVLEFVYPPPQIG